MPLPRYAHEVLVSMALDAVASGADKHITSDVLAERFPVSLADLSKALDEALEDALKQGVEREDIDPSWFEEPVS